MDLPSAIKIADLLTALSYFAIFLEIFLFVVWTKYAGNINGKAAILACPFIFFVAFCGITHLLETFDVSLPVIYVFKVVTAIVSALTALIFFYLLPRAVSLPLYVQEVKQVNKRMHNFRVMIECIWSSVSRGEEAIVANARLKLHRILPKQSLVDITVEEPPETGGRDSLSISIIDELRMYLRKANQLESAEIYLLHEISAQMHFAIRHARLLKLLNNERGGALDHEEQSPRQPQQQQQQKQPADAGWEEEEITELEIERASTRIERIIDILEGTPGLTEEQQRLISNLKNLTKEFPQMLKP